MGGVCHAWKGLVTYWSCQEPYTGIDNGTHLCHAGSSKFQFRVGNVGIPESLVHVVYVYVPLALGFPGVLLNFKNGSVC